MAIEWKIQGGSTVTSATAFGSLGLVGLVRTRRSLALDEVFFDHQNAALTDTPLFAYGDEVTITRVDGGVSTTWFKGRIVDIPREGAARMESIRYRVAGTWWYFENLVFQQLWPLDATANSHLTSPTTYRRAMVIAGMASSTLLRQNTKDFIVDVLDWLIGADTANKTQYTAGELPTGFNVPFSRLDAPTCAEALLKITRWMPDAMAWFDYSVNPPKFNLVRRSAASSASVQLTALAQVSVVPRNELKIDELIIQYVTINGSGLVVLTEDKDPSGSGNTGRDFGNVVITVDNNYQALPSGLAASFRAGLSTLQYSGSLVIDEEECSQSLRPGQVLNITGGPSAWSTMNASVQEVTEDVDHGRTIVRFGPPDHIRLNDLIEILKIAAGQVDQFGGAGEILKTGKQVNRMKQLTKDFNPSGAVPTTSEIQTAIQDAYSGQPAPWEGDEIDLTIDSLLCYTCSVSRQNPGTPGATGFVVSFTVGGVTSYAKVFRVRLPLLRTQALSVAGTTPTQAEVRTALVSAFSGSGVSRPFHGDEAVLTVSSTPKLLYKVNFDASSASGIRVIDFTIGGRTWYAVGQQLGIY